MKIKALNCKCAWLHICISRKPKKETIVTNWVVQLIKLITLFLSSLLPIIGIGMLYTGHTKPSPPISTQLFSFSWFSTAVTPLYSQPFFSHSLRCYNFLRCVATFYLDCAFLFYISVLKLCEQAIYSQCVVYTLKYEHYTSTGRNSFCYLEKDFIC